MARPKALSRLSMDAVRAENLVHIALRKNRVPSDDGRYVASLVRIH
jgi:hypothetical protein